MTFFNFITDKETIQYSSDKNKTLKQNSLTTLARCATTQLKKFELQRNVRVREKEKKLATFCAEKKN